MNRKKTPEINFDAWLTGAPGPATEPAEQPPVQERSRKRITPREPEEKSESRKKREPESGTDVARHPDRLTANEEKNRERVKEESNKTGIQTISQKGVPPNQNAALDAAATTAVRMNSGLSESKNSDEIMARIVALVAGQGQVEGSEKVKVSYHVNRTTVTTLDAIQFSLKNITGLTGHDISKSKILDIIMVLMAADLAEQGNSSRLAQILTQTAGNSEGSDE